MSPLRAASSGATGLLSSPIGIPRLAIRVGAAASTIIRCNQAGNKTRHAARRPHVRFGSRLCENPTDAMIPSLNRGGVMKGFVQGADRQQTTLLPECLDDWVDG